MQFVASGAVDIYILRKFERTEFQQNKNAVATHHHLCNVIEPDIIMVISS